MTTYERGLQEYPEVAEFEQQVHPQSEGHWCVCATETPWNYVMNMQFFSE